MCTPVDHFIIYVRKSRLMVCAYQRKLLWDVKDGTYQNKNKLP